VLVNSEKLEEVFALLSEGKTSIREAANELGITRSSLHRLYTSWVEKRVEKHKKKLLEIQEEIAALQSERDKIKEELARYEPLKSNVSELESRYNRLKEEIREALELREQKEELRAEVKNLQQKKNVLTLQVSELERRREELLWLTSGLERYRIWLQSEVERLLHEVNRLRGEKEDLQSSILALTAYKKQLG
jgi:chromosome segregation ATPase